jgi:hypothetical protein
MSGNTTNWQAYWQKYENPDILNQKSDNMDDTLREIESKLERKLLSGDHIQIISALEERIEELEQLVDSSV